MRALFLSDAHLRKPSDMNYQALLAFLEEQYGKTDILVLLGDIFEFWIGKAAVSDDHAPLIEILDRFHRQGTKLVYVEGNHDFHLGPVFTEQLHCQVFPDGGSIELDGKKVYLAHGDLANPNDVLYRQIRKLFRSNLTRYLIRTLPRRMLVAIADWASHVSSKNAGNRNNRWPAKEILQPYAKTILSLGYQVIITGHYHLPFHEKLGDGEHIALGDWITQYSYAIYENQTFTLLHYSTTDATTDSSV
jgi:UDP-2,3-diacylglucosamine hydrolase